MSFYLYIIDKFTLERILPPSHTHIKKKFKKPPKEHRVDETDYIAYKYQLNFYIFKKNIFFCELTVTKYASLFGF